MSLVTTPCVHHVTRSTTDLENVCFLEAVLPEKKKLGSNFIIWQTQTSFGFVHIQTADMSQSAMLCFAYEFIRTMTFHFSETKQELIHRNNVYLLWNVRAESAA
jgi:hypothetical protein